MRALQGAAVARADGRRARHRHRHGAGDVPSLPARAGSRRTSICRPGGSLAIGGAPMPAAAIAKLAEQLPRLQLDERYGATETTAAATMMPLGHTARHPTASAGRAVRRGADHGRGGARGSAGRGGRGLDQGADGGAGLLGERCRDPRELRRRLLALGRRRAPRRGGLPPDRGPHQGHDQPRRLQGVQRRGRAGARRASRRSSRRRSSPSPIRCSASGSTPSSPPATGG